MTAAAVMLVYAVLVVAVTAALVAYGVRHAYRPPLRRNPTLEQQMAVFVAAVAEMSRLIGEVLLPYARAAAEKLSALAAALRPPEP